MFTRPASALVLILLTAVVGRCDQPTKLPDTPAGKQLQRWLDAVAAGDKGRLKELIATHFAAGFLEAMPLDQHVEANARFAGETGGVTPHEIVMSTPTTLSVHAATRKGGRSYTVMIEVEASAPHKIARLGIRPTSPTVRVQAPPLPEGMLTDAQLASWLQEYLERLARADAFSGAVLLAHGDQHLVAKAHGLASRAWNQPNRVDTRFNLGSMNKMFTAIAIAQLVEQGKVSLDDPIGKHLPDYPNHDAATKVTVRHLLTHTSGLADYFNDKFMEASRARFRAVKDYFPLFVDAPLQFEPGSRFRYSNAGFMVLGAIVQQVSGEDYFEYVRKHIYGPAGMTSTDAYELDTDVPNLAVGYTRQDGVLRNNTFLHVLKGGPAGGGYSTVEDLFRFATALKAGKLIRPETFKQWTTPGPKNGGYAFGFEVYHAHDPKIIGHRGGFPGISSALSIDLDNGYTVAVLSNMDGGAEAVLERIKPVLARMQQSKHTAR